MSYTHSYFKDNKLKDRTVSDPAFVIPPSPAVDDYADANELNQYASAVGEVLAYDLNGNLIRRELPTGDVDSYTYDPENRLISADIQSRGKTASYTYDALDRRATKTVDGLVTAYLYDGQDVIAEYDGAGALLRRFVYGPGVDEPIVMIDAGGAKSFYHADRLGSIAALTDEAGATAVIYPYDPYGNTDADAVGNTHR